MTTPRVSPRPPQTLQARSPQLPGSLSLNLPGVSPHWRQSGVVFRLRSPTLGRLISDKVEKEYEHVSRGKSYAGPSPTPAGQPLPAAPVPPPVAHRPARRPRAAGVRHARLSGPHPKGRLPFRGVPLAPQCHGAGPQ